MQDDTGYPDGIFAEDTGLARLGLKAVAAGTMADFMSACIAAMPL